jgi:hypothetical protein
VAWYAYDANGYIGDVGTNTGWKALCDYLKESDNADAAYLANNGWSDGIDFTTIAAPEDEDVAKTLLNLKEVAVKCKEVLIISQGFEESEDLDDE